MSENNKVTELEKIVRAANEADRIAYLDYQRAVDLNNRETNLPSGKLIPVGQEGPREFHLSNAVLNWKEVIRTEKIWQTAVKAARQAYSDLETERERIDAEKKAQAWATKNMK